VPYWAVTVIIEIEDCRQVLGARSGGHARLVGPLPETVSRWPIELGSRQTWGAMATSEPDRAHESVECRLPGKAGSLWIKGAPDDESVIGLLRRTGTYSPHLLQLLDRLVQKDWISLDIGANVGVVALFLGRLSPGGAVYAFEPVPDSFSYLAENIRANAVENVSAHRLAISDRRGEAVLHYPKNLAGGAFSATTSTTLDEAMTTCVAPSWPLDEWVAAHGVRRVDLVKMDIEGGELSALAGATGLLSTAGPDLVVEVNPVVLRRFQSRSWEELVDAVARLYPNVFYVREDGALVNPFDRAHWERVLARHGLLDLYATRDPQRAAGAGVAKVGLAGWLRGAADWLLALVRLNRLLPPTRCFVVNPRYEARCALRSLRDGRETGWSLQSS
jgi:FkbM family methyltransferase